MIVKKYIVEVQPLLILKLSNIPERRFGWRSTSALGMPQVWLEEELANKFQVPAGAHLELTLADTNTRTLITNSRVRLADRYTSVHPAINTSGQIPSLVLQISGELKKDGEHPYTATLRRLATPAPTIVARPAVGAGGYSRPREQAIATEEEELEELEEHGRKIPVPAA
ncbi:MAG: hypothetical protein HYT16_00885 [DPANN group archaeon]|nr:hypothetical protein [DPANN group archaeon]